MPYLREATVLLNQEDEMDVDEDTEGLEEEVEDLDEDTDEDLDEKPE